MSQPWDGIVTRCTLNDSGSVPRAAQATSPDIIVSGTAPYPDPTMLTRPENYDREFGTSLSPGMPNYLYLRGKNASAAPVEGRWNLFWSTPNILPYPYLWENNQLTTSAGDRNPRFMAGAGAICASTDPFAWVPRDVSDYFSLVAIATTPDTPNPMIGAQTIYGLAQVLADNANVAMRTVNMIRGRRPVFVSDARYEHGQQGALVDLTARFENIPRGSAWSLSSGMPLNGKILSRSASNSTESSFAYRWADLDIPAHWSTRFDISLTLGNDWSGIPDDARPTITISVALPLPSAHWLHALGRPDRSRPDGQIRLLETGSASMVCVDAGP